MKEIINNALIGDLFIDSKSKDVYMLCQYGSHLDEVVLICLKEGKSWNYNPNNPLKDIGAAMRRTDGGEWIPVQSGCSVSVVQS
jgi:hypothetical protein